MDYNYTITQFPSEELPGASVFSKDADGNIFHTYSTYARGLDILVGTYNFLDMAPKGRDEDGLKHTMAWVRHHDKYDGGYFVDAEKDYEQPKMAERHQATPAAPANTTASVRPTLAKKKPRGWVLVLCGIMNQE